MIGKELGRGVIFLGRYVPEKFDSSWINQGLTDFTTKLGLRTYEREDADRVFTRRDGTGKELYLDHFHNSEVRPPANHREGYNQTWHRDYHEWNTQPLDFGMVLWASVSPTEIALDEREMTVGELDDNQTSYTQAPIISPAPFDVTLILNSVVLHRIPRNYNTERWFFRQYVHWPGEI
jgi:hypothetical protein